jgi:hypothetical protein
LKELAYYEQLADDFASRLTQGKQKRRKAKTLSDSDKDKLFAYMLNSVSEEERLRVLLFCAKRGYIAYR